jgi:hypothetical protein
MLPTEFEPRFCFTVFRSIVPVTKKKYDHHRKMKDCMEGKNNIDMDRRQEMALRPRIDGKFRSIKLVSPSNENAPLAQNE